MATALTRTSMPPALSLSPSRISEFERCPLAYQLKIIDKVPVLETKGSVRGRIVHNILEELIALPAQQRTPARAAALIVPAWQQMVTDHPGILTAVPRLDADFSRDVQTLIDTYFTLENPQTVCAVGCEMEIEAALDDHTTVRGKVDRLDVATSDQQLRVVDYKTSRFYKYREEDYLHQLMVYAWILTRLTSTAPPELVLLYLGDGTRKVYRPSSEEIEAVGRRMQATAHAVRAATVRGEFRPRRSSNCTGCGYREKCPLFGGRASSPSPAQTTRTTPCRDTSAAARHSRPRRR
ncbi:RecB family exonuclease [Nocardia niigatensis]